jgi:hypothetical protein
MKPEPGTMTDVMRLFFCHTDIPSRILEDLPNLLRYLAPGLYEVRVFLTGELECMQE